MTHESDNPWKKLESEKVYENPWYSVRSDKVIRPDGTPGQYNVIEALDGAFVLAVDEEERIQLIGKYRYTTDVYSLEVPAGGIDAGEDPLTAAKRELREELGLAAAQWQQIGKFQAENGYMNNFGVVFVATGLSEVGKDDRRVEGINKTVKKTIEESLQMVKASEITDSQSISALALLALNRSILK